MNVDSWATDHTVTDTSWTQASSGGSSIFAISQFDNAADWAVELFAPACNLEWSVYPLLLTRCTARPLESLGYDASLFFTYIQQFENEDTVR